MHEKWIEAIVKVGVPSLLALGFAYWVTVKLDTRIEAIQSDLRAHQIDTAYNVMVSQEQAAQLRVMYIMVQQICVNTAQSDEARQICWNPWSKVQ